MAAKKQENPAFTLPEGRVINNSFFERDIYTDERGNAGKPQYRVEMAFDDEDLDDLRDMMLDFAIEQWGEDEAMDPKEDRLHDDIITPFLDGDKLARKREKKGKEGEAYKGKTVIRLNTLYNKDGIEGPGGIAVFGPDMSPIELTLGNTGEVFNGCYGIAGAKLSAYENEKEDRHAIKLYLVAFQLTRGDKEKDKLGSSADHSTLFKPVGRAAGGRRTRKG